MIENAPKVGEAILINKVLLKPEKEVVESSQRKALFLTTCKVQLKFRKVVVDIGSTNNLVSTEMVENLKLRKFKNPTPYKVSWMHKGH